jgi:hypothetical protein
LPYEETAKVNVICRINKGKIEFEMWNSSHRSKKKRGDKTMKKAE